MCKFIFEIKTCSIVIKTTLNIIFMDRLLPSGLSPSALGFDKLSKFTEEEDIKLMKLVKRHGKNINWKDISVEMETRTPRQCRERYKNYLAPELSHVPWSEEENKQILELVEAFGFKWNIIAKNVLGRTGNSIRNRYQVLIRKEQKEKKLEKKQLSRKTNKGKLSNYIEECKKGESSLFESILNDALEKTFELFGTNTVSGNDPLENFM